MTKVLTKNFEHHLDVGHAIQDLMELYLFNSIMIFDKSIGESVRYLVVICVLDDDFQTLHDNGWRLA